MFLLITHFYRLFKNSFECFSNFINCILWDLIAILIKESVAAEESTNTIRCKNKIKVTVENEFEYTRQ
jgi:hypothetical protein